MAKKAKTRAGEPLVTEAELRRYVALHNEYHALHADLVRRLEPPAGPGRYGVGPLSVEVDFEFAAFDPTPFRDLSPARVARLNRLLGRDLATALWEFVADGPEAPRAFLSVGEEDPTITDYGPLLVVVRPLTDDAGRAG